VQVLSSSSSSLLLSIQVLAGPLRLKLSHTIVCQPYDDPSKQVCTLVGHSDRVLSVAFSRDGKKIVSGASDKLVKIWNAETGAEVSTLE